MLTRQAGDRRKRSRPRQAGGEEAGGQEAGRGEEAGREASGGEEAGSPSPPRRQGADHAQDSTANGRTAKKAERNRLAKGLGSSRPKGFDDGS